MSQMTGIGDYDLRGRDFETELIGQVTDAIIDADRLARLDFKTGMPGFALYRLILARDRFYLAIVRPWWVLFCAEWCRTRMRGAYSEEFAGMVALDSLQREMDPAHPILPAEEAAEALGVDLETYARARNELRRILSAAVDSYWALLCGTYRIVAYLERRER